MSSECRVMQELHAIRLQIYEETKHMTPAERAEACHREVEPILATYNLKVKQPTPPEHVKTTG